MAFSGCKFYMQAGEAIIELPPAALISLPDVSAQCSRPATTALPSSLSAVLRC